MRIALLTPWSWILPTNFQIPEFIRGYIGLIDTEVLRSVNRHISYFYHGYSRAQTREKTQRRGSRRFEIKSNNCHERTKALSWRTPGGKLNTRGAAAGWN